MSLSHSLLRVCALTFSVALAFLAGGGGTDARAAPERVVNPGAESGGTEGWEAVGFRAARYGESALVPSADYSQSPEYGHGGLGVWLFQATDPTAVMRQVVSLEDLAAEIDGGGQDLTVGGGLGGAGGSSDGMRMTARTLDSARAPLGAPVVIGPPTRADRSDRSAVVECRQEFRVPVGTRSVEITLEPANVTGATTAVADGFYVVPDTVFSAGGGVAGEGPGCSRYEPFEPGPQPTPTPPPEPGCSSEQRQRPSPSSRAGPPPGTQPAPSPPVPECVSPAPPGRARVSRVALTTTRLSLRVSHPATVRVLLERRARPRAARWQRVRTFTLRARKAGRVVRRLRRLRPGRYRININVRDPRTKPSTHTLVRRVKG